MLNCGLVFFYFHVCFPFLFHFFIYLCSCFVLGSMSVEIKASLNNTYCGFRADENSTNVMGEDERGMYEGIH